VLPFFGVVILNKIIISSLLAALLLGCGAQKSEAPKEEPKVAGPNLTQTPDVGKVEQVNVSAKGMGVTPGAAVNDALKTAVQQVNGVKVDAVSATLNTFSKVTADLNLETADYKDSARATATVQSQNFADQIVTQSKGLVSSFKVVKMTAPQKQGDMFTVDIEAQIAKFKAPADSGKIKIVVAPLKSNTATFDIGGVQVPAQEVLGPIRQQIIDALSQTGRFSILDRQFESELQGELDMISSGKSVNTDFAKLGQALSADLVWIGVVNDLSYKKTVRKLQTSDKELVSFAGTWSVSQRMINLTTRQILQSNTLQGNPPSIKPTTLGTNFDPSSLMVNIRDEIVKKSTEAILLRTFPISVVEKDGNTVVLSQGGQAVKEGARYRIYLQGKEIKDPQTGQSLGNMESICCEVTINRVTPNLSYGTLENVKVDIANIQPGALQIREAVPEVPPPAAAPVAVAAQPEPAPAPVATGTGAASPQPKVSSAKPKRSDDW
jgi:curli biogenesis system outer membrane secretion channel CsgG